MATATIHEVSTDTIKEAIITLIRENNTEFKQLIEGLSSPKKKANTKEIQQETPMEVVKKERVPYQEMYFWKANPDLKPLTLEGQGTTLAAIQALQALFQEPDCPPVEEWLAALD